jgi:hypothetical protein
MGMVFPSVPPLSSTCAADPDPHPPDRLPPLPLLRVALPLLPLPPTVALAASLKALSPAGVSKGGLCLLVYVLSAGVPDICQGET